MTSLQSREYPKSQMTGDVLSLSGLGLIWALREMGWNRFIKFLSFLRSPALADPDHLIPSPVMMITIRNSESRPINCGVSKHRWKNEHLGEYIFKCNGFMKIYDIETVENNWLFDYKQSCWKHFNPNCIFSLPIKEGKRQFLKQLFQSSTSITIILFCPEVLFYFFFIPSYCGRF